MSQENPLSNVQMTRQKSIKDVQSLMSEQQLRFQVTTNPVRGLEGVYELVQDRRRVGKEQLLRVLVLRAQGVRQLSTLPLRIIIAEHVGYKFYLQQVRQATKCGLPSNVPYENSSPPFGLIKKPNLEKLLQCSLPPPPQLLLPRRITRTVMQNSVLTVPQLTTRRTKKSSLFSLFFYFPLIFKRLCVCMYGEGETSPSFLLSFPLFWFLSPIYHSTDDGQVTPRVYHNLYAFPLPLSTNLLFFRFSSMILPSFICLTLFSLLRISVDFSYLRAFLSPQYSWYS